MGGICSRQELLAFIEERQLVVPQLGPGQVQPGSIDLRLGDKAWCLKASFLPKDGETIEQALERFKLFGFALSDTSSSVLGRGRTYVIELQEQAALPQGFTGDFNPKSSTGRADVLTRVLVEGERKFDTLTPGGPKRIYIECTPLSFHVLVRRGVALTQLRVASGDPSLDEEELRAIHSEHALLFGPDEKPIERLPLRHGGVELTVDLESPVAAYRAKVNSQDELDLTQGRGALAPKQDLFWEAIPRPGNGELVLEPDAFYLLATRELTRFPHTVCGTLAAYDVTSTEGRVHYAGFADPGFGFGERGEVPGRAITLEVRVYHKPFRIVHGQPFCIMRYQRMAGVARDEHGNLRVYGVGYPSNYHGQRGPTLAKQFLGR